MPPKHNDCVLQECPTPERCSEQCKNARRGNIDDDEVQRHFAAHAAHGPKHVVFAIVMGEGDEVEETAIFSTLALAREWVNSKPEECSAIFVPKIIDMPEYGNTTGH